jgi:hypothetical protein
LRNPRDSSKSGIGKNIDAWQNNEEVRCRKNLKRKDNTEASVILDVANAKVIKNRFGIERSFEELFAYYTEHYGDYINNWLKTQLQS